ncbi:MAG: hypothetical protein WBF17_08225 [Phycisphaerae bacterium]
MSDRNLVGFVNDSRRTYKNAQGWYFVRLAGHDEPSDILIFKWSEEKLGQYTNEFKTQWICGCIKMPRIPHGTTIADVALFGSCYDGAVEKGINVEATRTE